MIDEEQKKWHKEKWRENEEPEETPTERPHRDNDSLKNQEQIMLDGVDILKEKINMCFILLLNKLESPETIEQTIYEHLDAFVKEWNDELVHKMQECEELKESIKKAQELYKYFMNVAENTANKNKEL